jgi:divalent metal cation (Fe/Co/Zn/Cd) transporter
MSVTKRSRQEAKNHQCGVGRFEALSQMMAVLRIVYIVLFAVRCEQRAMKKDPSCVV